FSNGSPAFLIISRLICRFQSAKFELIKIQTVSQLASGLGLVFSNIREGKLEITPDLINLVSKIEKDLRELLFCIKKVHIHVM
ncbi:hypothetical protein, partial [Lysinibacillus sp. FJAT-14745]|uniref:hypothetical protein n=1 Tax=Lysinibacillus sp. FJAT-14745 TaxID=1704289 RepID=UPI001F25DEFA